ncbi:MAG TPA: hypothetical protein VHE78_10130, partial [Gemmatimonadaceae bacterium]|nr:hypothetical protein [Gemmatimonadaceae bacterium]
MIGLGELSLWMALLMAVWGAALSAAGGVLSRDDLIASAERGLVAATGFSAISVAGLSWALVSRDFALQYVAMHTSERVPVAYRISAMWADRAGSLLLWTLVLGLCSAVALRATRGDRVARIARGTSAVARTPGSRIATLLGGALAISLALSAVALNPFAGLNPIPANGRGLDPQLQDWTRILDMPLLMLGCGAALVSLALCLAVSWDGGFTAAQTRAARAWPVVAFCALAAGIGFRLAWAYTHRGAVPIAAFSQVPSGTVLAALLALLMAGIALGAGPRRPIGVYLATAGVVTLVA